MPVGELEELPPPPRRHSLFWGIGAALVIVVCAATVLTLNGSSMKSAVVVLSEAAARTTSSGTARSSTVENLTIDGVTTRPLNGEASEDFGNKSSTSTIFDTRGNAIETVRTVAGVVYLSIPKGAGLLPGGAHWISLTPADIKLDPVATSGIGSGDPSSGLRFLSAVDGDPRIVDHDPLDGVKVTHYAFTLNLAPLLDEMGKGSDALGMPAFGNALEELRSLIDLTKLPGEAWIDAGGRVRRFAMTITFADGGHTGSVVVDVRFSHFDEPVTVTAPAAADTVPFRQVPHFFSDLAGKSATHA
jgi:hypothetical protein